MVKNKLDKIMSIDYLNLKEKELINEQIVKLNSLRGLNLIIIILIFVFVILCAESNLLEKYEIFIAFISGGLFTFVLQRYLAFEMKIIDLQRDYSKFN